MVDDLHRQALAVVVCGKGNRSTVAWGPAINPRVKDGYRLTDNSIWNGSRELNNAIDYFAKRGNKTYKALTKEYVATLNEG